MTRVRHISRARNLAGAPVGFVVTLSCGHATLAAICALPMLTFWRVGSCEACQRWIDV